MNSSKHCKSSALRQCESAWFLYFSRPLIMETWNPGDFHRLSALGISPMALGLRKNNWRKYQCLAGLSGWIPESFHLRERIPRKWTSLDAWVQWTKGDVSIIMTPWGFLDNMHSVPAVCSALAANSSLFRHTFLGVRYSFEQGLSIFKLNPDVPEEFFVLVMVTRQEPSKERYHVLQTQTDSAPQWLI